MMKAVLASIGILILSVVSTSVQANSENKPFVEVIQADGGPETTAPICALFSELLRQEAVAAGNQFKASEYLRLKRGFRKVFHRVTGHNIRAAFGEKSIRSIARETLGDAQGEPILFDADAVANWEWCLEMAATYAETADLVK